MRPAILLLAFIALSVYAAESKSDKDIADCNKQGEAAGNEAVKKVTVKHPLDVVKIKEDAKRSKVNSCMAEKGYAVGKIRAK
jgi:transcriptional regulator of met regulon